MNWPENVQMAMRRLVHGIVIVHVCRSAQNDKRRGTFCTKGDYSGMFGGILYPRAICPGGMVGHSAWGEILPSRLTLRSTYVYV